MLGKKLTNFFFNFFRKNITVAVIVFVFIIFLVVTFCGLTASLAQAAETSSYKAQRIEQSNPFIINIQAGKAITFWVKFKNVGTSSWQKGAVVLKTENINQSPFTYSSWPAYNTPYIVKSGVGVKVIGTFKFALSAPDTNGLYWEKFQLFVNGQKIPGGEIEIGMNVYGGKDPVRPSSSMDQAQISKSNFWETIPADYEVKEEIKSAEPTLRVGLFYETSQKPYIYLPIKIKSLNNQAYRVKFLDEDKVFLTQTQGEETEIDFDFSSQKYFININGKRIAMTDSPIKFVSADSEKDVIFKITSWYRGPFWGQDCNDNEYRGELEIKYNSNTQRLWLINKLGIEEYIKGVAEVADSYPPEMLKAQKIAARTYAYDRLLFPKYTNVQEEDSPLFDLRSTQADQVYRGYLWEKRSPNIETAAIATSGMIITYNNDPALVYYFARSNGRTLSSCEAGMTKECLPYLTSVDDPPGKGLSRLGHGVGMPQQSAKVAADQGAKFNQILQYYFQGTDIKKVW